MHLYTLIFITKLYTLALVLIFLTSPLLFRPPYQRLIWDYKKADSEIDLVNWDRLFSNKDINTQVSILNETMCPINVFSNYVPNKCITIDDKNPAWMNETIKLKIKAKDNMYKNCIQNGRFESDFLFLKL